MNESVDVSFAPVSEIKGVLLHPELKIGICGFSIRKMNGTYEQKSVFFQRGSSSIPERFLFQVMDCLPSKQSRRMTLYMRLLTRNGQGKPYYVYAVTAGANKFLRIYYGRVNENILCLSRKRITSFQTSGDFGEAAVHPFLQ